MAAERSRVSTAIGVYVPAMNTKIIEWSSRFISACARGLQVSRWYSADVPNSNVTVPQ
jgi:hypothetical protein